MGAYYGLKIQRLSQTPFQRLSKWGREDVSYSHYCWKFYHLRTQQQESSWFYNFQAKAVYKEYVATSFIHPFIQWIPMCSHFASGTGNIKINKKKTLKSKLTQQNIVASEQREVCNKWHRGALQSGVWRRPSQKGQLNWGLEDGSASDRGVKEVSPTKRKSTFRKFGMFRTF